LELVSQWKKSDLLNFDFNYTYTSTYDGAEQDDPNRNLNYNNSQMVRVPRNIFNLKTNIKIPGYDNLDLALKTKWSDVARDYGNGNRTFADERLDDYLVNDLSIKYNLMNTYNMFFDINNIMNEKYETARDYSQMDRSFNFGIRRAY
jgi:outer membrane receptor protein involved in Fe transport